MTEPGNHSDWFARLWANGASPDLDEVVSGLGAVDAAELCELVRIDQSERWERDDRRPAEEYLERYPMLRADAGRTVDLIYHEYLLREKRGERPMPEEFMTRFPQHAAAIAQQVEFHLALGPATGNTGKRAVVEPPVDDTLKSNESSDKSSSNGMIQRSLGAMPGNVGRYEILGAVGVGSFGAVYKARDPGLDRIVAIKIPRSGSVNGKGDVERFLREARSVAQLRHPSIVSVHDSGQSGDTPYLVSEFVQGTTLAERLSSRRTAPRESAELIATLADALHYAHEMGVVHRDVKPANIMLDEQGVPRLTDFGLARRDSSDATMTIDGQVLGTPGYMSPEQARGQSRGVDGRSDIYSLGVILYQLLTGELPFRGTAPMLLHQLLHEEPKRPSALSDRVPRDLETICLKAMAKEPCARYASARDMADDLRRFLQGEPIHARPIGGVERLWRWCRRKPALAAMTAAAAILLVAVAVGGTIAALQFQKQAEDAEEELYFTSIGRAHLELTAGLPKPGRAEELLDACPPERRNWEWDYLKRLWRTEPVVLSVPTSGKFRGVTFSHDGSQLAAACGDGKIRVWDQKTGEMVVLPGHDALVYSVAFSPVDSNRLASSGRDGWVRVWDVDLGREMLPLLPGFKSDAVGLAYCVAFSPDGKVIAAASEGDTVQVWEVASGRRTHRLRGHALQPSCVTFSRDGRLLASGDWGGAVRIWDVQTGQLLKALQLPDHRRTVVASIAFSPDPAGQFLAAGYFNNRVDVWDTASGERHCELRGHSGFITSVAFHPHDARRLASAGEDRDVRIWDVPTGRQVLQLRGHIDNCSGLAFRPDGRLLASASYDQTIRLWDATTVEDKQAHLLHAFDLGRAVWCVAISSDGKRIAASAEGTDLRIWETMTGREVRIAPTSFWHVFSLAFSSDGTRVSAAGFDDGAPPTVVKVVDTATEESVLEHREEQEIFATEFSPDGRWVAFGLADGSVKLADAMNGNVIAIVGKHMDPIAYGGLRFRRDGQRLASASSDGTARIWDFSSAISAAGREGESVSPSPSDHLLCQVSSGDPGIALWSVSYSPDGRHLITGDKDGQLRRWDAETGDELPMKSQESRGAYLSVAYSPNGRWIVSASEDCTVRVYDAQTLELVRKFRGHLGPIRCLAVSNELVVTGGADRRVMVWDLQHLEKKP